MATDYVSILRKAVAGAGDGRERQNVYRRARNAVAALPPGEHLTLAQISSEARALEAAIREIEAAFEEAGRDADRVDAPPPAPSDLLRDAPNWKRFAFVAGAFFLVIGAAAMTLWHFAGRNPRASLAGAQTRIVPDVVPDLDPGVDGGSSAVDLPFALQRQVVFYRSTIVPGSIVVDREKRYLYLIETDKSARRYGIGISRECLKPGSLYRIAAKQEWPEWRRTSGTVMQGGVGNPLGARALLFDQPDRLIHGTNSPKTIGYLVGSGCIRLVNEDVEHLYQRVPVETRVIMRN